ncbi:MAG TPA: glycosyltransferase family 2 protein [Streptosporangiaceae bacterium]|nr:glycosyltransferase family 2 protein [Streptosporangiaceae bacterium]
MHNFEHGSEDLTQALGRAQRRPSDQPASTRDLPGLMRHRTGGRAEHPRLPAQRRPGSMRKLSPMRVPLPRSPLEDLAGHEDGAGQVVVMNGHHVNGKKLGQADGALDGALDKTGFREIADGMAIAPRITVVLPVMNEAANLPGVFASMPRWVDEVVLVDGRSSDDSIGVARRLWPEVKVVLQGGVGKGDALAAGFAAATGDIIVAIDADGSTDGNEISRFVSALLSGADFAKGSRFSSAGSSDDITMFRRCGNKVLNVAVNRLFGTSFTDLCYGYNAFWARHLDKLEVDAPGFEVETLLSIRAAEAGLLIHEVPSHERLRQHGVSNLSALRDGWRVLRLIASEKRVARRRKAARPKPFMAPGRLAGEGEYPVIESGAEGHGERQLLDGIIYRSSREAGR